MQSRSACSTVPLLAERQHTTHLGGIGPERELHDTWLERSMLEQFVTTAYVDDASPERLLDGLSPCNAAARGAARRHGAGAPAPQHPAGAQDLPTELDSPRPERPGRSTAHGWSAEIPKRRTNTHALTASVNTILYRTMRFSFLYSLPPSRHAKHVEDTTSWD